MVENVVTDDCICLFVCLHVPLVVFPSDISTVARLAVIEGGAGFADLSLPWSVATTFVHWDSIWSVLFAPHALHLVGAPWFSAVSRSAS